MARPSVAPGSLAKGPPRLSIVPDPQDEALHAEPCSVWWCDGFAGSGPPRELGAISSFRSGWKQYLAECGVPALLFSTSLLAAVSLTAEGSSLFAGLSPAARGLLATAFFCTELVLLIYSPWGVLSGAHYNPILTLTYFRLKKISRWDTFYYCLAQAAGWTLAIVVFDAVTGARGAQFEYFVTKPGPSGAAAAFGTELLASFGLIATVLACFRSRRATQLLGWIIGLYLFGAITLAGPISGASFNPARSLASALLAGEYGDLWLYFSAPILGAMLATELFLLFDRRKARRSV